MIRNEAEYKKAVERIREEASRIEAQKAELAAMGLTPDQVTRATDPLISFHLQLVEEVNSYERLKRGEFDPIMNLGGLGTLLIAMRIAKGISQKELAERLGVHESQVSRDERNEYHGVTLERAQRVLEALGVQVMSRVESLECQVA
ncbi:MAG: helix-turn-helix domain-containing protein [Candidatus Methanospirareceae archaeon]